MTKKQKIFIWGAVIAVALIALFLYMRNKSLKDQIASSSVKPSSSGSTSTNTTSGTTSGTGATPTASGLYIGTDYTKFKLDQRLRATKLVNIYKSKSAVSGNIGQTFQAGSIVGYFRGLENGWIKVEYLTSYLGYAYYDVGYAYASTSGLATY